MSLLDRKVNNSEGSKDKFKMAAHVLSSSHLKLGGGTGGKIGHR
jgi:hypothetical protein